MKQNYFQLGRKGLYALFFLVTALAVTAFTPVKDPDLPPVKKNYFFDPAQYVAFTVSGFITRAIPMDY